MLDKGQNRKQILQQLLQKSQIFNAYFKNQVQENINCIMNISAKRNQVVQFGKCEINLPERVKLSPQKFQGKVLVMSKNKKQINKIKEKYENLSRLRENQGLRLSLNATQAQRNVDIQSPTVYIEQNRKSKLLLDNPSKYISQQQIETDKVINSSPVKQSQKRENFLSKYQIHNKQFPIVTQRQRQYVIQDNSQRTRNFKSQNLKYRSSSAKVRPQFDFFLKYNDVTQQIPRYKSSFEKKPTPEGQNNYQPKQRQKNEDFYKLKKEIRQNIQIKLQAASTTRKEQVRFSKKASSISSMKQKTDGTNKIQLLQKDNDNQNPMKNYQSQKITSNIDSMINMQKFVQDTLQTSKQQKQTSVRLNQQEKEGQLERNQENNFTISQKNYQNNQYSSPDRRSSSFSVKKYQNPAINKNYQQKVEQQKKQKINFRRELHKTYNRTFIPPPKITAKSYTIYEMKVEGIQQSGKILATINGKNAQEIASLTKIMTCIITLEIGKNLGLNLSNQTVQIGKFETLITGTSAQIKIGEIYTVQQLLYGLMLPSGNDASLALGVWGGRQLIQNDKKNQPEGSSNLLDECLKKLYKKDYINRFIQEMNKKAVFLNMNKTHYANTHGLVNNQNKSSSIDLALLCEYVMNNQQFTKICKTKIYESTIKYKEVKLRNSSQQISKQNLEKNEQANIASQRYIEQTDIQSLSSPKLDKQIILKNREIKWQNTHYLLHKRPSQYIGIKTGVTNVAGPCLASCIYNKETGRKFIIVVLGCKNMLGRFKQTQILKKWLYKQQNIPQPKVRKFKPRTLSLNEQKSQIISQIDGDLNSDEDDLNDDKYKETQD